MYSRKLAAGVSVSGVRATGVSVSGVRASVTGRTLGVLLAAVLVLGICSCKSGSGGGEFCQAPVRLEKGTDGSAGREGEYVLFGDWPQTVKAEDVEILEQEPLVRGMFEMYRGSDGFLYVKVLEKGFNMGSTYSDGSSVQKEKACSERFFKVEPIKWRVLDWNYGGSGNVLLLAEDILDSGIPFYPGCNSREIRGRQVAANSYEYSTLRAYYCGYYQDGDPQVSMFRSYVEEGKGFLQSAFTPQAQRLICNTEVDNSLMEMSYDGEHGVQELFVCQDTVDKVFSVSTLEMIAAGGYGFAAYDSAEGGQRVRKATDYALAKGAYQSVMGELGGFWWLRSPYYGCNFDIRYVSDNGTMELTDYVWDEIDGIVPAVCVPSRCLK